jgi:glycosyltransferase involved in cell wall biosynthesis
MHYIEKKQKNILWVTGDISYPGGTEEFTRGLLEYISTQYSNKFNLYLYESCSHGLFVNKSIYKSISKSTKEIIRPASKNYDPFDTRKSIELQKIIDDYQIDIIHSSLFISDFITLVATQGLEKTKDLVKNIPSSKQLPLISSHLNSFLDSHLVLPPKEVVWISTKFCNFSIALQEDTPKWKMKKEIFDEELEPLVSISTDKIISVSSAIIEKWSQWNQNICKVPCSSIGKSDLKKIENFKESKSRLKQKYGITKFDRVFVSNSRLEPQKGIEDLLQAFKLYCKNCSSNTLLFVCGGGSLLKELKDKYQSQNIRFLGHLERNIMLEVLSISDICCLLSYSEGLPLSIQEGMASSNAILASNVGGIPDLVSESNGILVNPGNTTEIKTAVKRLSQMDKAELKQMKYKSYKNIKDSFLKESSYEKYIKIYNQNYEGTGESLHSSS